MQDTEPDLMPRQGAQRRQVGWSWSTNLSLLVLHGVQDTDKEQGGTIPPQGRRPGRMAGGAWPGSLSPALTESDGADIQT